MSDFDLGSLTDEQINMLYSDTLETGGPLLIAKQCWIYFNATRYDVSSGACIGYTYDSCYSMYSSSSSSGGSCRDFASYYYI